MKLEDFIRDSSGIYVGNKNGTKAGYLDGAESYLFNVLKNSHDLGLYSSELKSAIKDWPSLYHFSPYRTTILECLGLQTNAAEVLELGAGCGAVTRWLGEKFRDVHSVEGNYSRAHVARLRCRDLSNVKVYAANFLDLEIWGRFDIATLIGVLEYSHLYHPLYNNSPFDAALSTLKMVFESLKNHGILILALENKFGLKYFSGAREDHSGKIFDSIHGYPEGSTAVTFSAAELEAMLQKSGFSSVDFYLPFPDYKLAATIINGDELSPDYYLHNWIDTPFPDRCSPGRTLLFNESLAVRQLIKGGMLKELSNSFLIVAYKGDKGSVSRGLNMRKKDWVAKHYSLGRYASFCKKNSLKKTTSGELFVDNINAISERTQKVHSESPFVHNLSQEKYYHGDQLIFLVLEMLASDKFETEFIQVIKALNLFLVDQYATGKHDSNGIPLLKGDALDVLLWNIIVEEKSGQWVVVDREWICSESLPVDYMIWRNLHHMLMRYHSYIDENINESISKEFIMGCLRSIYPSFNEERYLKAKRMEDYFQDFAHEGVIPNREELSSVYGHQIVLNKDSQSTNTEFRDDKHLYTGTGSSEQKGVTIKGLASIIIPVYNKAEYTKQCLENIAANTSYDPYEVIIIDNASTDETKELLESLEGNVKIVSNEKNLGFAKSCNQGAAAADGEYLVFLNNDTIPQRDWLKSLVNVVREKKDVAIVGSKLLFPDNTVQHAGVVFRVSETEYHLSHIYRGMDKDYPGVNHMREFNAVTAACLLIRKNVFYENGMFDENYINGYEDVDLCLRVREQGHKIIYNPESVLYHYEETTEGRLSYGEHNAEHFLKKWKGKIESDESKKLMEDGLRIEYLPGNLMRYHHINNVKEDVMDSTNISVKRDRSYVHNEPVHANNRGHAEDKHFAVKKVAIVRGASLNKWEMQNYEPLMDDYDITAYTTSRTLFDISKIKFPVVQLPFKSQGVLLKMEGLEDQLADKDIVFSADITYKYTAQAVLAKKKSGSRVVCLEWENIPFNYEESEEVRSIKEVARAGADHFIAVTDRAKEALMIEGVPEEKIDVVPMGVDLKVFRPEKANITAVREELGIDEDDTVVIFIGRMVWEKGIYDLLYAAAKLYRDCTINKDKLKFLIVGKGPEKDRMRKRAKKLGIYDRIIFLEKYPYQDIYKLYNLADIFVLPSIPVKNWQEQFGMVLIESMACGTPVISTLTGSIPEVVGDAGMLVQPNDHLSLYSAIKKLVINKDLREDLGDKALSRAKTLFEARRNTDKFRAVFEKVMSVKTAKDTLREAYIRGSGLWKEGKREEGFDLVCRIFNEDPDSKEVLDTIINMGMELEQYKIVEKAIREYLMYHPASLEVMTSLSDVLLHLGKIDQAREELEKVFIFDAQNKRAVELIEKMNAMAT